METLNQAKFRELVLHIAARYESVPRYGKTTLYKILFYADFEAYRRTRKSITGARYLAWERGPVPESEERNLIESRMVSDGDLALKRADQEQRYIALREPDYSLFSAEEIAIVDHAIDKSRGDTAAKVSDRAHEELLAWQAAFAEHEATGRQVVIPYGAVFVSNPVLDEFEEAHALNLARRHHWPA